MNSRIFTFQQPVTRALIRLGLCFLLLITFTASANAATSNICYKTGSELDLDSPNNANTRAKLSNPNYFGPAGSAAPETLTFTTLATVNTSTLTSNGCDIFYGGGSPTLSVAEATDIMNWSQTGVNKFILAGCDYPSNNICSVFGRGLTANSNGGVSIVDNVLAYNPLGCGGALSLGTYGGASTYHGTFAGDIIMATHDGAPAGQTAAVITDGMVNNSTFMFSADADMFGNGGNAAIGPGPVASTDQAKFIINSFKYALDVVRDRLDNPECVDDYDQLTDLAITSSLANATLGLGQQTTITFTLTNESVTDTDDIEATLLIPSGMSYVSQSGNGSFNSTSNVWTIGALAGGAVATITLTIQADAVTTDIISGEVTSANLADIDSAANSSFATDDRDDAIVDDDETIQNVTIIEADFGDAPRSMTSIDADLTNTYEEAAHGIDNAVYLGNLIDADLGTQAAGLLADGDDSDGTDDEDGVSFPLAGATSVLRVDQPNTITVEASVNGYLNAWIDWNQDGDWADTNEAIAVNTPLSAGTNTLTITPGITVPHGATYARFRFTSAAVASPSPTGVLADGEVEDYRINLLLSTPIDQCSSVVLNTGFEAPPNPATYHIRPEEEIEGWATIADNPSSGANYSQRNGIELWQSGFNGVPSFEGNYFAELNAHVPSMLYQDVELTPGSSYTWSFAHRGRSGVDTIRVLMGEPDALVSQGSYSTDNTAWTVYNGIYTVPPGQFITRFGFQAVGSSSIGNFLDAVKIPGGCDFGDAPNSYGTELNNNGAHHVSNILLHLGSNPGDSETDGQSNISASGDDAIGVADEDGVSILNSLSDLNRTYAVDTVVTNQTGSTARLIAWIDFDGNGTFDPDEAAIRDVPTGTANSTVTLTWANIPLDIQTGNSYLRVRLTSDPINNSQPTGRKSDGEVEDYPITITTAGVMLSGRVYIDTNSDSVNDANESGIGGTVVILHDIFTGTCRSVMTTANGDYYFSGVPDGGYEIYQAHGETTPTPQNCGTAFANNPVGYQSTSADILYITVAGVDLNNQDFGEIAGTNGPSGNTGRGIRFDPDHQGEVLPGNNAFYPHIFSAEANGSVSFNGVGSGNISNGWSHTLYLDTDCNGGLNGAEGNTSIDGSNLPVTAGNRLCLINKVYAPANVALQDRYTVTTTATFQYSSGAAAPVTLEVDDVTIAGQIVDPTKPTANLIGESRLKLVKTVENQTQGTPETQTFNQARPGDFLKYRIYYRNTGSGNITDLKVNDMVPSHASLVGGSAACEQTPSGMTCTPAININELTWSFTGSLIGGDTGHVSYEVMVNN